MPWFPDSFSQKGRRSQGSSRVFLTKGKSRKLWYITPKLLRYPRHPCWAQLFSCLKWKFAFWAGLFVVVVLCCLMVFRWLYQLMVLLEQVVFASFLLLKELVVLSIDISFDHCTCDFFQNNAHTTRSLFILAAAAGYKRKSIDISAGWVW